MSLRTDMGRLKGEFDRIRTITSAQRTDYADDAGAMMAAAGFPPDPWQKSVLDTEKDTLITASRQSGKTTVVALKALYTATYRPYSTTLIMAPSERQAKELYGAVRFMHRTTGEIVPADLVSHLRLELTNSARIMVVPASEKTSRGYSPDLVILDEAARIPDEVYYQSVRPMLAVSEGQLICLSTPWGRRGFFFHEWMEGGDHWKRVKVTAPECARINEERLELERQSLPRHIFESEFMCIFGEVIDSVFRMQDILEAFTEDVEPLELGELEVLAA